MSFACSTYGSINARRPCGSAAPFASNGTNCFSEGKSRRPQLLMSAKAAFVPPISTANAKSWVLSGCASMWRIDPLCLVAAPRVRDFHSLSIVLDDDVLETAGLDQFILMPGGNMKRCYKDQCGSASIDHPVRVLRWDMSDRSSLPRNSMVITSAAFHLQKALALHAVVDLRLVVPGVEVTFGHVVFIAYFAWEDGCRAKRHI